MQNNNHPGSGLLCECVCLFVCVCVLGGQVGGMSRLNYSQESEGRLEIELIFDNEC